MDIIDWKLWNNITFKTQGYRKNFDLITDDENIITEYDGVISEVRIVNQKPPFIVGEYGFSVWNIGLGKMLGVDFDKLISDHSTENSYGELFNMVKKKEIVLTNYKKIVLVHTLIVHKNYRKRGMTEEFVEMLYRDFYDDNIAIIMLVKPFQNNLIDADFYFNRKSVPVRETLRSSEVTNVPAAEYYSLNELTKKEDTEFNEYKLFSTATKCGFSRIDESHLFIFSPEEIIKRIKSKYKH
jgi:hypothetical protein